MYFNTKNIKTMRMGYDETEKCVAGVVPYLTFVYVKNNLTEKKRKNVVRRIRIKKSRGGVRHLSTHQGLRAILRAHCVTLLTLRYLLLTAPIASPRGAHAV